MNFFRDENEPEMTEDEDATKPEGWLDDEPELIPDPSAEKPSDWLAFSFADVSSTSVSLV